MIRPDSVAEMRNRLAEFTLLLLAFLGLPALVISLLRVGEFGWLTSMYAHLAGYVLIVILCVFRKRFSYQVKAGAVLALLFVIGTLSFPNFAAAGSGVFFYLAIVVLGTLFYGFRGGLTAMVVCLAGFFLAMSATLTGTIRPSVDLNFYAISVSSWNGKLATFLLLGGLCLGLMSLMQGWLLGSIKDMSDQIEEHRRTESILASSLAEKDVLLREVHHRVKSNLQVIMGLLDLHLSRVDSPVDIRAITDSKNRLKVMAQIHENLYNSRDLTNIDFSLFLKTLADGIVASYGNDSDHIDMELKLEHVDLSVDTAIPCGLIVNELLTNSLKYAFKDRDKGKIRIEFSRTDEDLYTLVVADNGTGFSPNEGAKEGTHIGLSLIEGISQQLGAETKWKTEGETEFTMVFSEYREVGADVY